MSEHYQPNNDIDNNNNDEDEEQIDIEEEMSKSRRSHHPHVSRKKFKKRTIKKQRAIIFLTWNNKENNF